MAESVLRPSRWRDLAFTPMFRDGRSVGEGDAAGVKRGLAEALLLLNAGQDVVADFNRVRLAIAQRPRALTSAPFLRAHGHRRPLRPQMVGEVGEDDPAWAPYCFSSELYGSTSMLLACLDKESLARVCVGYKCDLYERLGTVRAARPCRGGSGCDPRAVADVRSLEIRLADNPGP